jgi:hypothetical protein
MKEEIIATIEVQNNQAIFCTSCRAVVAKLVGTGTSVGMTFAFGWLASGIAESKMRAKKLKELSQISPESILTDNKKNFAVPYEEITRLELGKKLKIFTGPKKLEFRLSNAKEREAYANALRPMLGERLVVS